MKVRLTYFYMIRKFALHEVPFSTAMYDPKWYHDNKGPHHTFLDKRGVLNGLRINPFVPGPKTEGLCTGPKGLGTVCNGDPSQCQFLKEYDKQIRRHNIGAFVKWWQGVQETLTQYVHTTTRPEPVLVFHEKADNPCSERTIITKWLTENGIEVEEYQPNPENT